MKYNGIILSDIHFGVIDDSVLMTELNESFLKYVSSLKKLDFIIITGDYFDHKIYLSDNTTNYAMMFMDKLVSICKKHNALIRIVYGTESHEVNQYNIFSIYENDDTLDFKIIHTVQEEKLFKDINVLYLPEEHIYSKKEYYKEFFNKEDKYNYVFGHGVIQEVMTYVTKNKEEKESTRKKVPVFKTKELSDICKGQVYFGHYHINVNIADEIFYVGSFTRWQHGESEPKGFYHITYDSDKDIYKQKFIENQLAKKYITYTYGYTHDVMASEEKLIDELNKKDKLTECEDGTYVRYIFNIPENHPNPEFIIKVLHDRYKFNDNIKVDVTNGYIEKKNKINKQKVNEILDEYSMIFDKSIEIEDKIIYYIKKKYDKELSYDVVHNILC